MTRPTRPRKATTEKPLPGRALRIELEGSGSNVRVILRALTPERFQRFGHGTFLTKTKPGEISITQAALDALLAQPYRSGLQQVEIFGDSAPCVIAWGTPGNTAKAPLAAVSRHDPSKWFRKCCLVEENIPLPGRPILGVVTREGKRRSTDKTDQSGTVEP